jgi:hypothetical protein
MGTSNPTFAEVGCRAKGNSQRRNFLPPKMHISNLVSGAEMTKGQEYGRPKHENGVHSPAGELLEHCHRKRVRRSAFRPDDERFLSSHSPERPLGRRGIFVSSPVRLYGTGTRRLTAANPAHGQPA